MPLEVKKQPRESSQNLIRRFTQKIRQSGIVLEVRKRRFKGKNLNRNLKKKLALRRIKKKKEYERLKKLGREI